VVAAPRTPGGRTLALDIVQAALDLTGKTILTPVFSMSRRPEERPVAHRQAAELVQSHLEQGLAVAFLNLGDPGLFSTFPYVADIIRCGGYPVEVIPGVTSVSAAAARLGISLTRPDTPVRIIPEGWRGVEPLPPGETLVWLKSGKGFTRLLQRLAAAGRLEGSLAVENCGLPGEKVHRDLVNFPPEAGYLTLVISPALPEDSPPPENKDNL
jgi:precorrin-2/cobalt-factor-2 C20-methyltransferase